MIGLALLATLLLFFSTVLGPTPDTTEQWIGVITAGLAVIATTLLSLLFGFFFDLKRAKDDAQERLNISLGDLSIKQQEEIRKIVNDLIPSTARLTRRIELAAQDSTSAEAQLLAAKDNAQTLTQIIVSLCELCNFDITVANDTFKKALKQVDTAASVFIPEIGLSPIDDEAHLNESES